MGAIGQHNVISKHWRPMQRKRQGKHILPCKTGELECTNKNFLLSDNIEQKASNHYSDKVQ